MAAAIKRPRRWLLSAAVGAAVMHALSPVARAQTYPTRPTRLIGQWLSERLGQPIVVENRTGAGTAIGTEIALRAPADGYTLLLAISANAINAAVYENLPFNFIR